MATYTDIFCGAGGSSIGLSAAGHDLILAANHWPRAIETHSANFPDADHLVADVSNYDMRRLPRTDVLWASPECTWHSPAGGRKRIRAQLDLFDEYVPDDAGVRSRATAYDVLRAAEVHRYKVIIVENVVEFAAWESFDQWLGWLHSLGYTTQLVNVSAAHIGSPTNPHAPQWRDRLYVVATAKGVPIPDVRPRPTAWCPECDEIVAAVQSWKRQRARQVGKYGQQYVYRCPNTSCRNAIVEPFVLPAAAAIDWTDVGTRIGDRPKPLAAATIRRIEAGLRMFAQPTTVAVHGNTWERPGYTRAWPAYDAPLNARTGTPGDGLAVPPMLVPVGGTWNTEARSLDEPMRTRTANPKGMESLLLPPVVVYTNHDDGESRAYSADEWPLAARTVKIGEGVVTAPFVTMLRANNRPMGMDEPLATMTTGRHHYLTTPPGAFLQKHHGGVDYEPIEHMVKHVDEPMPGIVSRPNVSLVIPYRRTSRPKTTDEPLHTLSTHDSAALVAPAVEVEDCHFRMLQPREHLRGQRFPDAYVVHGNKGEQTMQAGNAVPSNVAQWLGGGIAFALGEAAA